MLPWWLSKKRRSVRPAHSARQRVFRPFLEQLEKRELLDAALPTVTALGPNVGPTSGGALVTISGTNLSAVSGVSFGGTPASSFSCNASTNQITAVAPAEAAGQVDVQLVSSAGNSPTSAADLFTYTTNAAQQPIANADAYVVHAGTTLMAGTYGSSTPGLQANDWLPSSTATTSLVSAPAHGTLTLNANGSFTYAPNAQFVGADSFTYQNFIGQSASNIATVSVDVTDTAPVATTTDYLVHAGTTLNVGAMGSTTAGVLAAASDADSDRLTALLVSGPSHGTLAFGTDGSFFYTPTTGFTGTDSFVYEASDGTLTSSPATVYLDVVNTPPVANAAVYKVIAGQTLPVPNYGGDTPVNGLLARPVTRTTTR
jgi:hypothetical protein